MTDLPCGWASTRLGDPFSWGSGGTPSRSREAHFGGPIPWVVIGDLNDGLVTEASESITTSGFATSSAKWVEAGAVLLAMYGSIGKLGIAGRQLTTNQAIAFTHCPTGISNRYLFYYLMSRRSMLLGQGKGGTQSNISQTVIKAFPFVCAPTNEQERIVEAIDSYITRLDDAVASLERVQAKLKAYRASVLKAAVEGRLVPTEAALARVEKRAYEPAKVLLARILKERRRRWEESELAKLKAAGKVPKDEKWKAKYKEPAAPDTSTLPGPPEGWSWATVEGVSTKVVDGVHKKPDYVSNGVPFVTVKNLTAGPGIDLENLKYITTEDHEAFIARANPERGDLLVSKDGTLGVIRAVRTDRVFSIFVSVAMVKPVLISMSDYLEVALSSPTVQVQMVPKGSGLQHIHLEDLRRDCVPIPPAAEQARVLEATQRHMSVVDWAEDAVTHNLARLSRLRQAVLKWAFEGKLAEQDPTEEPAERLLARIRTKRATVAPTKKGRVHRAKGTA